MMLVEHRVGNIAAIPANEGRTLRAGGHLVTVFHLRSGAVRATQPWCPHRGGPLADGLIGDDTVICPLHNRAFNLSSGEAKSNETGIATFPARVESDGTIVVSLPDTDQLPCLTDGDMTGPEPVALDEPFANRPR
jgi:nitrite reductase (NADH) small subunit